MKKKLYLHIGLHKTGTTSIQATLSNNLEEIKKHGYSLFNEAPNGNTILNGNFSYGWVNAPLEQYKTGYGATIYKPELLVEKLSNLDTPNVIASSENLSWIFEPSQIHDFSKLLESNFDTKIVVYIRRQDKLAVSHIQQGYKSHKRAAYHFYNNSNGKALLEYENKLDNYFDYHKKISLWAKYFGKENIIIRIFDRKLLFKNDAVLDFLNVIGYPIPSFQPEVLNTSNSFIETKLGYLLNKSKLRGKININIRKAVSCEETSLPSRKKAEAFYQHFLDSNIALNEEYHITDEHPDIFDNIFSNYPEVESDLWCDETANQAILSILNTIADSQMEMKPIRKAAKLLNKSHPNLSKALKSLVK